MNEHEYVFSRRHHSGRGWRDDEARRLRKLVDDLKIGDALDSKQGVKVYRVPNNGSRSHGYIIAVPKSGKLPHPGQMAWDNCYECLFIGYHDDSPQMFAQARAKVVDWLLSCGIEGVRFVARGGMDVPFRAMVRRV